MSTSSVFPLEIYERILELVMENSPYDSHTMRHLFCYVCTAWRWKCRTLGFQYLTFSEDAVGRMAMVRRCLPAKPYVPALVENVLLCIPLPGPPYQSSVESFPSLLGRFLPRLRSVTIISPVICSIPIPPLFLVRRVFLHTVTVLQVSKILFDKHCTFEWFIAPFPSLRVLDLWSVTWKVASKPQGTLPVLTELELRIGNNGRSTWMKNNRDAYERLLDATRATLRSLTVNVFPIYIFTSLHDYKTPNITLEALEMLSLEVHTHPHLESIGKDGKPIPYSQCLSDMVSFLSRVDAKKTRVINLTFEIDPKYSSMTHDDFLDCLRSNVRKGLEDLVTNDHFPALQAICVIFVGAHKALVPIWQDRFDSCFPLLAERQLLHVKEYIRKERPGHRR